MPTKPETRRAARHRPTDAAGRRGPRPRGHFALQGSALSRLLGRGAAPSRRSTGSTSRCAAARCWAWWGSPAAARPRSGRAIPRPGAVDRRAASPTTAGTAATSSSPSCGGSELRAAAHQHADGLPGPRRGPQPGHDDRGGHRPPAGHPPQAQGRRAARQGLRGAREGRPRRRSSATSRSTPPTSPAARSSGPSSPARSSSSPRCVIADEPVSMLDMSVRAKILQLMLDLKAELDLTYVYITHDLASAKYVCDRIAIMYLGRIVEIGPTQEIFEQPAAPLHPGAAQGDPRAGPGPDGRPRPAARRDPGRRRAAARAARSTRAARRPSRSAAGSPATSGPCSRSTGPATRRRPSTPSATMVGDLDKLDKPELVGARWAPRTPAGTLALLNRIRAENPDEPFWRGVAAARGGRQRRAGRVPGSRPTRRCAGPAASRWPACSTPTTATRADAAAAASRCHRVRRRPRAAWRDGRRGAAERPGTARGGRTSRSCGPGSAGSRRSRAPRRIAAQIAWTLRSVASRSASSGS